MVVGVSVNVITAPMKDGSRDASMLAMEENVLGVKEVSSCEAAAKLGVMVRTVADTANESKDDCRRVDGYLSEEVNTVVMMLGLNWVSVPAKLLMVMSMTRATEPGGEVIMLPATASRDTCRDALVNRFIQYVLRVLPE
jgi:hypothetical protein